MSTRTQQVWKHFSTRQALLHNVSKYYLYQQYLNKIIANVFINVFIRSKQHLNVVLAQNVIPNELPTVATIHVLDMKISQL